MAAVDQVTDQVTAAAGQPGDAAWVARMGVWGTRVLGLVVLLALVFTMVNVQQFAAAGQVLSSVQWWIAWLLDPMASITMGAAIVYEGLLADYGRTVGWLTATKWYAGLCTWAMNIWVSVTGGSLAGVLLHSVAPGLVLLLAEAAPRVRRHLAEIVTDLQQSQPPPAAGAGHTPVAVPPATYRRVAPPRTAWAPPPPPRQADLVGTAAAAPTTVLAAPTGPDPVTCPVAAPPAPVPAPGRVVPPPVQFPADPELAGDDDLTERVRRLVAESTAAGRPLGRRAIAKRLDTTEHRVRAALELVGATTGAALNGTSGSAQDEGHHQVGGQ